MDNYTNALLMQINRQPMPVNALASKGPPTRNPHQSPMTAAFPGKVPGLVAVGNIDIAKRPVVKNPDGSISTVRSISIGTDQGEVLIPTVSPDGRILTTQQAIQLYRQTGRHLGIFNSPDAATQYAQALHSQQAAMYAR